ncbi:hypothetical protein [Bradyrhizobium sp. sBnM-33]|uniref:hypothetical protein n=1 Tax=Bradyrhizobium sp. sBnM-33 TaxID=2831780 RepID=UPI001BCB1EF6|nr:hypothetical protein [Bradyrhizobium sp. sBnM-33]
MKCPGCGQWYDMRDLGQVLHVHDAEIEVIEGDGLPSRHELTHRLIEAATERRTSSAASRLP